ncbi:hypothetical protein Scep_024746 [Stephania cephalantha]|uniref:Uncharacterized protein n=1 Tax=Stephania cephalantha TaxID=152367 RepID=A0AAP0EX53_9MAGN
MAAGSEEVATIAPATTARSRIAIGSRHVRPGRTSSAARFSSGAGRAKRAARSGNDASRRATTPARPWDRIGSDEQRRRDAMRRDARNSGGGVSSAHGGACSERSADGRRATQRWRVFIGRMRDFDDIATTRWRDLGVGCRVRKSRRERRLRFAFLELYCCSSLCDDSYLVKLLLIEWVQWQVSHGYCLSAI